MFDLHNSVDSTLVLPTNCTTKIKKGLSATLFIFTVQPPLGPVPAALWYNVQLLLQDTPQLLVVKVAPVKKPSVTSFSPKFEYEEERSNT